MVYFCTRIISMTVRQAVNHVIAKMYFKFALQSMIDMVASVLLLVNRLLQTLPHVYHTVMTTCDKILKCMWGRIGSTPSITAMTLRQRNTCITKNDTAIVKCHIFRHSYIFQVHNVFVILFW